MPATETSPSVAADQLTRALGEAVIRIWSDLPQRCRIICSRARSRHAANPSGRSLRSSCMTSIRAVVPLGNPRDMKEPDSLGG